MLFFSSVFLAFSLLGLTYLANLKLNGTFPFLESLLTLAPHVVRHQSPSILRRIWAVDL